MGGRGEKFQPAVARTSSCLDHPAGDGGEGGLGDGRCFWLQWGGVGLSRPRA